MTFEMLNAKVYRGWVQLSPWFARILLIARGDDVEISEAKVLSSHFVSVST